MVIVARLRRRADISLVRAEGVAFTDPLCATYARRAGGSAVRIAVAAPRSLGTAVRRNKARRRLREALQTELRGRERMPGGDLFVIARAAAGRAPSAAVRAAAIRLVDGAVRAWGPR